MNEDAPDHRLGRGFPDRAGALAEHRARTLHVSAVFRGVDEQHVQTVAAEMIARAHELANRPECQCDVDVDVSVQRVAPTVPADEC